MGELLGITGAIGSGKTTFAVLLSDQVEDHACYETSTPIIEVANRFNQLLEAELNFETTDDDTELVNQVLIWMPDILTEHLHFDTTWNRLAVTAKDKRIHPELYEKLFAYINQVRASQNIVEQTINIDNKHIYRSLLQWLGGYLVAKLGPTIWLDEIFRRIDMHDATRSLVTITGLRYPSDSELVRKHRGRIIHVVRDTPQPDNNDITEAQRSLITPDITVFNNGTLEQFEAVATALWNDIAAGKPKKEYRAN